MFNFDKEDVQKRLKDSDWELGSFYGFLHRRGKLEHFYEKFRFAGDADKPLFADVHHAVKQHIKVILPKERSMDCER